MPHAILRRHLSFTCLPLGSGRARQPSRGLGSRDGTNPEKKIATDFGCVAHDLIVGEAIGEVKVTGPTRGGRIKPD